MKENIRHAKINETKGENILSRKANKGFSRAKHTPVGQILHLQKTIGNRAVTRMIQSGIIQAKLKIGPPNDKYEQEADRVANRVMTMNNDQLSMFNVQKPGIQQKTGYAESPGSKGTVPVKAKPPAETITPLVQRKEEEEVQEKPLIKSEEEEMEEEGVQAKLLAQRQEDKEEEAQTKPLVRRQQGSSGKRTASSHFESRVSAAKGGGRPLSESTRSFFEPRFGADFSKVRVHTDSTAVQSAQSINAKAFSTGSNIFFNSGYYSPGTSTGNYLLAHELTHTIQQGGVVRAQSLNISSTSHKIQRNSDDELPLSNVTYTMDGEKAGKVIANPLSKNPGNTQGNSNTKTTIPGDESRRILPGRLVTPRRRQEYWMQTNFVKTHLLSHRLHGPSTTWNLAYATRSVNNRMEKNENYVADRPNDVFYYETKVDYWKNADEDWKKSFASLFTITLNYLKRSSDGSWKEDNSKSVPKFGPYKSEIPHAAGSPPPTIPLPRIPQSLEDAYAVADKMNSEEGIGWTDIARALNHGTSVRPKRGNDWTASNVFSVVKTLRKKSGRGI